MKNYEILIKDFQRTEKENTKASKQSLKNNIAIFESFFEVQQKLFDNHFWGVLDPYYGLQNYERIVMQSFRKNIHLLYIAHNLTVQGNYGSANILLRQVFEFLILGKYAFIKKDDSMATKWLNRHQFDIYNKILKYLEKPSKTNFHNYWKIICIQAHATTSSHQITYKFEENKSQIHATSGFILLLLRCNYHLLSVCFINTRLSFRSEFYHYLKKSNSQLKVKARLLKKQILNMYSPLGKELIKDYETKWFFKK